MSQPDASTLLQASCIAASAAAANAATASMSLSEDPGAEPASDLLTYDEVAKHTSGDDCWIVVNNKVYDVTAFLDDHPGGRAVIEQVAGMDGTEAFLSAHPEDIITMTLGPKGKAAAFKGMVDPSTMPMKTAMSPKGKAEDTEDAPTQTIGNEIPPLEAMLNLHDVEAVAQRVMVASGKKQAWDYYSSGADDELTYNENVNAFQRIWLKPRILVRERARARGCV